MQSTELLFDLYVDMKFCLEFQEGVANREIDREVMVRKSMMEWV